MSFGSFALLPNITGDTRYCYSLNGKVVSTGALKGSKMSDIASLISNTTPAHENLAIDFNAFNSNAIYNGTTVQPSSLILNYIIKY